jgi:hypothetical protein
MNGSGDPQCRGAESWGDRLKFGALNGVLLAWLIAGVYQAATLDVPRGGKVGGLARTLSPASLALFGGCLSIGLLCGCLPGAGRVAAEAAIIGAFLGYVGAMVASRLKYGFGPELEWDRFLAGVRDSQRFTVPLGALVGACCGLVYWRYRRNRRTVYRGDGADPSRRESCKG